MKKKKKNRKLSLKNNKNDFLKKIIQFDCFFIIINENLIQLKIFNIEKNIIEKTFLSIYNNYKAFKVQQYL